MTGSGKAPLTLAYLLALVVPTGVIFNLLPSTTLFNQVAGIAGWGLVVRALPPSSLSLRARSIPAMSALLFFAALAAGAVACAQLSRVPLDYAWATAGMMAAAAVVLLAALGVQGQDATRNALDALALSIYAAGALNVAVAGLQVFLPQWTDGVWLAQTDLQGRGIGNLRQPNLMALLLLWAMISVWWWHGSGRVGIRTASLLLAPLVFGIALTASRAGVLGVVGLGAWAWLAYRRRRDAPEAVLRFTPLMLVPSWGLLAIWAHLSGGAFAAASRAAEGVSSPPRLAILADGWRLALAHPWTGVGWGGLNFAWALTPNPARTNYNFDQTHNLISQWLVELGFPLTVALTGLLAWALVRAFNATRAAQGLDRVARMCCFAVVLSMVIENQLEFPGWYSYLLLPSVFCLGICLRRTPDGVAGSAKPIARTPAWNAVGLLMVLAAAGVVLDYMRVVPIFSIYYFDEPIEPRLSEGRRSILFSGPAYYASVTKQKLQRQSLDFAPAAAHWFADPRFLILWSRALHDAGEEDKARYLAARAREFNRPEDAFFFKACADPTVGVQPFQCLPPLHRLTDEDFKQP